jgi:hypothetical protein
MEISEVQCRAFWRWLAEHWAEFNCLSKPDEPFWDTILEELKKVDGRLWFELSEAGSAEREFVVTAEGDVDAFPIVETLVSLAPEIGGWVFVALKPAMGFDFATRYEGTLFDPSQIWFLPLESASRPHEFGVRVGIHGHESMDKAVARSAVLVILDTGLGERSAALEIQHIEVVELPEKPESCGYIELPELADYIAWRKKTRGSGPT